MILREPIHIGPVRLTSPVIWGSGEHLRTAEQIGAAIDAGAAAVVAKSANESAAGRRQSAAVAWSLLDADWRPAGAGTTRASLLNRSGLSTEPWDAWVETLARLDRVAEARHAYVVASIIPANVGELTRLVEDVRAAGLRWIELNLSAPHAAESEPGSIARPSTTGEVGRMVAIARAASPGLALTVKLTAEASDLVALGRAARDAGADGLVMMGRHAAFLPDPHTRRPLLGTFGAISGPWALPLTLHWVARTRLALGPDVPVIATNGIRTGLDVARALLAGAHAVEIGTVPMLEGQAGVQSLLSELDDFLAGEDPRALVGAAADAATDYLTAAGLETGRNL